RRFWTSRQPRSCLPCRRLRPMLPPAPGALICSPPTVGKEGWMNGIAAPIVALEPIETSDVLGAHPAVSVVMVVYMTGEALHESVACVLADPSVDELVIVDNGSTGADAAVLRALAQGDERVVLLAGHGNVGFARGANLGAHT